MNRAALLTVGRKLQGDNMYLLSVFDLEPSGVIVHAYNQADSKEYILPITELEVCNVLTVVYIILLMTHRNSL
jgi:hypothetical protein